MINKVLSARNRINKTAFNSKSFRIRLYIIIAVTMLCLSFPIMANASLGGYEIQDLYQSITDNANETNNLLKRAFDFAQISPYEIVNGIAGTAQGNIAVAVRNASKSMALVVATLLLMVEFFRKSINFEWSSKWENILIFLIKIIVIKQVVQNADVIMSYIYAGFQSINRAATGGSATFLPSGNSMVYVIVKPYHGDNLFEWAASLFVKADTYDYYTISQDAVKMFYPKAVFPPQGTYNIDDYPFIIPTDSSTFIPILEQFFLQPYFLLLKGCAILIFVITIGRVFELSLYTIFAPLPLSTFASDTTHDIAKNFIKNYIATVLQIAVIAVMFIIYAAVNKYITTSNIFSGTKLIQIVTLLALTTSVFKSGTWSKKICGIG